MDISKQAVNVAKENAKLNEVPVLFERSDLFEMVTEKFDVIVSNPPYIPTDVIPQLMPEVQVFEPIEALDGKEVYIKSENGVKNHSLCAFERVSLFDGESREKMYLK